MSGKILSTVPFTSTIALLCLPIAVNVSLSLFSGGGSGLNFSGFADLFTSLRINELLRIITRSLLICCSATMIFFLISIIVYFKMSEKFMSVFLIVITLPFLVNESVRVFAWQNVLAPDGVLNS